MVFLDYKLPSPNDIKREARPWVRASQVRFIKKKIFQGPYGPKSIIWVVTGDGFFIPKNSLLIVVLRSFQVILPQVVLIYDKLLKLKNSKFHSN